MGPRTCIGKNIALVEMNKWIAQFFRHFNAEIVNKERPFKVRGFWFATQEEFYIQLSKRVDA
jgi:cytochrome P450